MARPPQAGGLTLVVPLCPTAGALPAPSGGGPAFSVPNGVNLCTMRNRMRQLRTYGSVGTLGGQLPGAIWPAALAAFLLGVAFTYASAG